MIVCVNSNLEDCPPDGVRPGQDGKLPNILQWSSKGRTSGSYPENNVRIVRLHPHAHVAQQEEAKDLSIWCKGNI